MDEIADIMYTQEQLNQAVNEAVNEAVAVANRERDEANRRIKELEDEMESIRRALADLGCAFSMIEFRLICKNPSCLMNAMVFAYERQAMRLLVTTAQCHAGSATSPCH